MQSHVGRIRERWREFGGCRKKWKGGRDQFSCCNSQVDKGVEKKIMIRDKDENVSVFLLLSCWVMNM